MLSIMFLAFVVPSSTNPGYLEEQETDEICETDPVDAETPQSPRLLQMMWNSYMTEFVQVEQCALVSQALDYFID